MDLPSSVNVLGVRYEIQYVEKPSDVDIFKRKSLWGQIDYWTRTIRVYSNNRPVEDIWGTILHEVIHAITNALHMDRLESKDANDDVDLLAIALIDVIARNGWMEF